MTELGLGARTRVALGAAYGWRARIGFLQPTMGNPNHPFEFYLAAPEGVTLSVATLGSVDDPPTEFLSPESLARVVRRVPLGVEELLGQDPTVIVQAGIPHLTAQGRGVEDELRQAVSQVTSVPFLMDVRTSIEAMHALGMRRVVMASPFTDLAGQQVVEYVRPDGIEIVQAYRVQVPGSRAAYGLPLGTVYQEAKAAWLGAGQPDGIWLPGAAMPTLGMIAALEDDLGVPVISSKQAMLWAAFKAAHVAPPAAGFGRLFTL